MKLVIYFTFTYWAVKVFYYTVIRVKVSFYYMNNDLLYFSVVDWDKGKVFNVMIERYFY